MLTRVVAQVSKRVSNSALSATNPYKIRPTTSHPRTPKVQCTRGYPKKLCRLLWAQQAAIAQTLPDGLPLQGVKLSHHLFFSIAFTAGGLIQPLTIPTIR